MPNAKTMKTTIQLRRDTTANWLANKDVVPAEGEPCYDLELGILKVGDGTTTYENLPEISGSGALTTHYEGVRGDGETDAEVITRVLAAANAEAVQGDVFVVKALIATGKYSYTAYVFDGANWAAMDGNYSAENVYFANDLTYTANIGVLSVPSSGSGTLAAAGKNVKDVFASILAKEKNPSATQPAVTATCEQLGAYEVGTSVTPSYSASLSAGSYTYGPATGVVATAWSVTNGTATKSEATGSFDALTVADNTSYSITATATHGEGASPVTNLGNEYAAGKIAAGNKSGTAYKNASNRNVTKITGYRNSFYGTLTAKDGELNSALVRGLGKSNKALAAGNSFSVSIPVGAIRVVFAYPATLRDVNSVQDVNGMNAEIKSAFTKSVVSVEGANGYDAIDYKVYVMDMAKANDAANTYKVTI
nr:MAG TPA: hyaluronidase [Caudoviricetes sp.]